MDQLADYYAKRATEYERIYAKPERQADLAALRARIGKIFKGKHVLELACGTGYWTDVIASSAAQVTALDVNEEVLKIARTKTERGQGHVPCAAVPTRFRTSGASMTPSLPASGGRTCRWKSWTGF